MPGHTISEITSHTHTTMLPHCRVCGEPGTGFHYGVTTCGACKGFFRRSLIREDPYICTENHMCQIGPSTSRRQSCPKCRYDKCIAVGMSKNACKVGRYSLTKKSKDMEEALAEKDPTASPSPASRQSSSPPGCYPASLTPIHPDDKDSARLPYNPHPHFPKTSAGKTSPISEHFMDSPKDKEVNENDRTKNKNSDESPSFFTDQEGDFDDEGDNEMSEKGGDFLDVQLRHPVSFPGLTSEGIISESYRVSSGDSCFEGENDFYSGCKRNKKKPCEEDSHFFMNYYMGNPDDANCAVSVTGCSHGNHDMSDNRMLCNVANATRHHYDNSTLSPPSYVDSGISSSPPYTNCTIRSSPCYVDSTIPSSPSYTDSTIHSSPSYTDSPIRSSPSYTVLQPSNGGNKSLTPWVDSYSNQSRSNTLNSRDFHCNNNNNNSDDANNLSNPFINDNSNNNNNNNNNIGNSVPYPPLAHNSSISSASCSTPELFPLHSSPSAISTNPHHAFTSSLHHESMRHQTPCSTFSTDNRVFSQQHQQHRNVTTPSKNSSMSDIPNELLLPPFPTTSVNSTTGDYSPPQSTGTYSNDSTESKQFMNFNGSEPESYHSYNDNISNNSTISKPFVELSRADSNSFLHQHHQDISQNDLNQNLMRQNAAVSIEETITKNDNNNSHRYSGFSKKRQCQSEEDYETILNTKKPKLEINSYGQTTTDDVTSNAIVPLSVSDASKNKNKISLKLCIHLPDNLKFGLSVIDRFPFKFYGKNSLAPFMKMCYNLDDCVKMANSRIPQSLLQLKPAHSLDLKGGRRFPDSSYTPPTFHLDSLLSNDNLAEELTMYPQDVAYDDKEMEKFYDCLQNIHTRYYGPKSSFLADSDIETTLDMFSAICQLQDMLQGGLKLIDDDKYYTILEATGLDVDKRKEWLDYVFQDFDVHFIRDAKFFRALPGFKDFTLQDRIALTKSTFFNFIGVRHCRTTNFEKDVSIDEELGLAIRITTCHRVFPGLTLIRDAWQKTTNEFRDMDISFEELVIIKALLIIFPDFCDDLEKPELVTQWHNIYLKCLLHRVRRTHGAQADERFKSFVNIIQRIKTLHEPLKQSRYALADTLKRLVHVDQPLFKEMFLDLPYRPEPGPILFETFN